jgi:hypothetical protein
MKVSAFPTIFSIQPTRINLRRWLKGYDKYNEIIKKLRNECDPEIRKKLKLTLPCCIPSGVFTKGSDDAIEIFSGLMCLDFDNVWPFRQIKWEILKNRHTWYCGISASGSGYFALVSVNHEAAQSKSNWKRYYSKLSQGFGNASKFVDPQCSNISRKRLYSWDPDGTFNEKALENPFHLPSINNIGALKHYSPPSGNTVDNKNRITLLINQIEKKQVDITATYNDWISIGATLANLFREDGRETFHRISQFYPDYNFKEVDKQFNRSLKNTPDFREGIIFKIAKKYGVFLKLQTK